MTTTDKVIESLVQLTHGASDLRTQHLYRQSLQVLVELAKSEERQESAIDLPFGNRNTVTGTLH